MEILLAAVIGFVLDLLLGDPAWMPHPVVAMGRCITALEKFLRRVFPPTPEGERRAGVVLAVVLPVGAGGISLGLLWLCGLITPWLRFGLSAFWCWQCLAIRGLADESAAVCRQLEHGTLPEARQAVSRIVGRDTQELTAAGVTRAAVETVAENFSDGVTAPLLYMMIGGAPLALAYKAINTMDSMVGYKTARHLNFGRAAAKLDDAANYVPARLSAVLLLLAAAISGLDWRRGWKIWRRDRRRHASPNSAQTEAAVAGVLGVQLAGPASYFGTMVTKPTIGDAVRPVEAEDILRTGRLMKLASLLGLVLMAAVRGALAWH